MEQPEGDIDVCNQLVREQYHDSPCKWYWTSQATIHSDKNSMHLI